MATWSCEHKARISCALTTLPACCSCADKRPQSTEGYADYVDGVGMTMSGQRWTKYCSRCRDYWHSENRREVMLEQQDPWAFPPRASASNLPVPSRQALPGVSIRGEPTTHQPVGNAQPQPLPPNPFGTREELASEDYESPLTNMFTRAYTRYRDAENTRRQVERELQDRLLAESTVTQGSIAYADELRRIHAIARNMVSDMVQSQYPQRPARQPTPSPPRVNPIDQQSRPPSLSGSDMVVSIACRICNEQRIDTLMEPCLHACMCHWCSEIIRDQAQRSRRRRRAGFGNLEDTGGHQDVWKCPICRHAVSGVRRIYLC